MNFSLKRGKFQLMIPSPSGSFTLKAVEGLNRKFLITDVATSVAISAFHLSVTAVWQKTSIEGSEERLEVMFTPVTIGVRGGGAGGGGAVAPIVAKIFGQNAWDSGKSARDKIYIDSNIYFHIESGFYNTTKRSMFQTFKWLCCRFAAR